MVRLGKITIITTYLREPNRHFEMVGLHPGMGHRRFPWLCQKRVDTLPKCRYRYPPNHGLVANKLMDRSHE